MAKDTQPDTAPAPIVGLTPEQLTQILQHVGDTNATAMKRSLKPENENPPPNSVFHPLGVEKPALTRECFFNGSKQYEDQLTPEEVRAWNGITHSCSAHGGQWKAVVEQNGTANRVLVTVPAKGIDQLMDLPSLTLILRELAGGPQAVDVDFLAAEVERLKAQLISA